MLDVYPAGEAPIPAPTAARCAAPFAVAGKWIRSGARFGRAAEMLASVLTGNDLVLVQGAGNIGKIARHRLKSN